jgi:hypothetical protein
MSQLIRPDAHAVAPVGAAPMSQLSRPDARATTPVGTARMPHAVMLAWPLPQWGRRSQYLQSLSMSRLVSPGQMLPPDRPSDLLRVTRVGCRCWQRSPDHPRPPPACPRGHHPRHLGRRMPFDSGPFVH